MSHPNRITAPQILARKGKDPVVCLTAYSAPMAKILDAHCDILLVGDSLGMVLYGLPSTLGVGLDIMIAHGAAVVRGSQKSLIVVDMPFGSYQESKEQAFRNAARVMSETGCGAIKIEGGVEMAETVSYLAQRGIPVMGHIGLQPQSVNSLGGYKAQGKTDLNAKKLKQDALAIESAGAFAVVIEAVMEPIARALTKSLKIPTIGIGASPACDGQVLVSDDMLGLNTGHVPRFVKPYARLAADIEKAAQAFAKDVRARKFPSTEYCFSAKK